MKILNVKHKDEIKDIKIFNGENSGIQRFDFYHYPETKNLEKKMRGAIWSPDEVSLNNDILYYPKLPAWTRAIFEANIEFQTLMDSGNNRGLENALLPLITSPEVEAMIKTQSYFELIHSLSYAHNLITVFPNPTQLYNSIHTNKFICNRIDKEIDCYERLVDIGLENVNIFRNLKEKMKFSNNSIIDKLVSSIEVLKDFVEKKINKDKWEDYKKKTILEALIRINALEGLKFYVSFLMTYKINDEFGNKIPGATKIIKLINFDEDLHVLVFQFLINTLRKEKKEGFTHLFEKGKNGEDSFFESLTKKIYKEVYEDEIEWAEYLLSFTDAIKKEQIPNDKGGVEEFTRTEAVNLKDEERINELKDLGFFISEPKTIPGLTLDVLKNFMQYYTNLRIKAIGIEDKMFNNAKKDGTVEWFIKYKNINNERTAAQETEILSYSIGQLVNDITDETFVSPLFDISDFEKKEVEIIS